MYSHSVIFVVPPSSLRTFTHKFLPLNEILAEDLKPYGEDSFEISDESLSDLNEGLQTI